MLHVTRTSVQKLTACTPIVQVFCAAQVDTSPQPQARAHPSGTHGPTLLEFRGLRSGSGIHPFCVPLFCCTLGAFLCPTPRPSTSSRFGGTLKCRLYGASCSEPCAPGGCRLRAQFQRSLPYHAFRFRPLLLWGQGSVSWRGQGTPNLYPLAPSCWAGGLGLRLLLGSTASRPVI
jgi:hypothetical protein